MACRGATEEWNPSKLLVPLLLARAGVWIQPSIKQQRDFISKMQINITLLLIIECQH